MSNLMEFWKMVKLLEEYPCICLQPYRMGWVYFPVNNYFPANKLSSILAKNRLRITGRSNIQKLCNRSKLNMENIDEDRIIEMCWEDRTL